MLCAPLTLPISTVKLEGRGRGHVYLCKDRYHNLLFVSQNLGRIARYLALRGIDDAKTSSLYDAIDRDLLYKSRWKIERFPLEDAPAHIESERPHYKQTLVLGNTAAYKIKL